MYELIGTVPGTVIKEGSIINSNAELTVSQSVSQREVNIMAKGLVVATCGGYSYPQASPICFEAHKLALEVVAKGGVMINGGENGGTMLAISTAEQDYTMHIACPYSDEIAFCKKVLVNSYSTRKNILTILPIVVVFPGKVGTLDELMSCLGWIKSLPKQHAIPPKLFIHRYWWPVMELLYKMDAIQSEVWEKISVFDKSEQVVAKL